MKIILTVAACLLIALGVGGASYSIGLEQGKSEQSSQLSTTKKALDDKNYSNTSIVARNQQLISDYNKLVEDYNTLRQAATQYVNTNTYQARQPLNCTSSSWGINQQYTSTSCY